MFTIKREFDENILKKLGVSAGEMAYVARDGEDISGYCVYRLNGDTVELVALDARGDLGLADGIARAAMASCEEGAPYVAIAGKSDALKSFAKGIALPEGGRLEISAVLKQCHGHC